MSSLHLPSMYKALICRITDLVLFLETCLNSKTLFN